MRRALWLCLLLACKDDPPDGSISIVTGEETDTFSRTPSPTVLVVEQVNADDTSKEIARVNLPTDSIDLGTPGKEDVAQYRVTGYDAANNKLIRGESLFFQVGALEAASLPIFVSRTGELARVPDSPPVAFDSPSVEIVLGRYVMQVSGTSVLLYDLLFNRTNDAPPTLPRPGKSIVTFGTEVVAIDENGATTFDLSTGEQAETTLPAGGSWAEIAGGSTLRSNTNTSFVIGATRPDTQSQRILVISSSGVVSFASLTVPRKGACAAYVTGKGLVIAGGDQGTPELLADGTTQAVPLAYPAEPLEGCGAAWLDGTRVMVAKNKVNVIDLACSQNCTGQPWPGDLPYVRAQATGFSGDSALITGDDANGVGHVFRLSSGAAKEIPIKAPRKGARLLPLLDSSAVLLGGAAQIEMYRD